MKLTLAAAALLVGGCNLINSNTFSVPYEFDPQEYQKSLGSAQGNLPQETCDPAASSSCTQAAAAIPAGSSLTASCDSLSKQCTASTVLRLSYPIDLSSQSSFPTDAIKYGINFVNISKVRYWVVSNTLTVGTPPLELYVAPAAAKDETGGTRLGSLGPLGAKSQACTDPVDKDGDDKAMGAMVCDLPLDQAGTDALANFAKDYKNPFQIIAHTVVVAKGGDPLPAGAIDFVVRPVISIGIVR